MKITELVKNLFTALLSCTMMTVVKADVYTFEIAGNWNQESNWDIYPGTTKASADEVVISSDVIINASIIIDGNLMISSGVSVTNNWLLSVNGMMTKMEL